MSAQRGTEQVAVAGGGQGRGSGWSPAAASSSLEQYENSVTERYEEDSLGYEVTKCRCDCWFCPDCCRVKGYELRANLVPILEDFAGLLMATFTVDPSLFNTPRAAFDYLRERRCLSRTVQDLRRGGYLGSPRYFYVIEWQRRTEQVHYHVLFDTSFIPFHALLDSWSKHRPPEAGRVIGSRPPFGTVWVSKQHFEGGPLHAARYATKYLVKVPQTGFPAWVLDMGKDSRVRRYGTSRGFWGREPVERDEPETRQERNPRSYRERIAECGSTVNVCAVTEVIDTWTGEFDVKRRWVGQLNVRAQEVAELPRRDFWKKARLVVGAERLDELVGAVHEAAGGAVAWLRRAAM